MIFTDTSHNIAVDLIGISSCKIVVLNGDLKQLEGWSRLLNAYIREAPIDGGNPAQFTYNVNPEEKCITITGNMMEAINVLQALGRIGDGLRDDIIEQIALDTFRQTFETLHIERREHFMSKVQAAAGLSLPPHHSPTLFIGKP